VVTIGAAEMEDTKPAGTAEEGDRTLTCLCFQRRRLNAQDCASSKKRRALPSARAKRQWKFHRWRSRRLRLPLQRAAVAIELRHSCNTPVRATNTQWLRDALPHS
jgi:hypothetical protein